MKIRSAFRTGPAVFGFALAASCAGGPTAFSHEAPAALVTDAAAIAAYPLTTCVVSGDKLEDGDMGPPFNYVYKDAGEPDRLVRLCCKSCIKKFNTEPARYLKMIEDAAAKKAKGRAPAATDGHAR